MRNGETHFEQVPIEVAKTVLRQAAALAEELEQKPAPVPGARARNHRGIFAATGKYSIQRATMRNMI
jgi:hypothetical protein